MHLASFLRPLCLRTSVVFLFTFTLPPLAAQIATSRPVGYLVQTIPAGQTRSFSVPFDAELSSQSGAVGRLTAV
ncbi:MAG: hypothetical protein ACKVVO_15535, partial [Opitutaceae bacterium]